MALAARVTDPTPFDLKSASLSALALVLRTSDAKALGAAMQSQFGETPDVFNHDPVVIDLAHLPDPAATLDFAEIANLLRRHKLLPVAVRGGSEAHKAAALAAGLGEAADEPPPAASPRRKRGEAKAEAPVPKFADTEPAPAPVAPVAAEPAPVAAAVAAPAGATSAATAPPSTLAAEPKPAPPIEPDLPNGTITIYKPLRSGQQVYAKGGDLIVLAAVNFGAEVLADGNIHVYGPLRGKAVAGAKGNTAARIFSTCMEPELVAIAGTYRTTENPLPADVVGKPAQIRLDGERLVFEPLT